MLLRSTLTRLLPPRLRQWLRPLVVPLLYRLEQGRMQRLLATMVRPGDLAFDVGAAEGYVSQVLLRLGARVVCVEPQPYCLEVLQHRFGSHPRVSIVGAGAGAEIGQATLHVSETDPEISTFAIDKWRSGPYADYHWQHEVVVPVVTIDSLIASHGVPAFCKIDVEGMEHQVLQGLSQAPAALSFELTGAFVNDVRLCAEHLQSLGEPHFNLSLYRRHTLFSNTWYDDPEHLLTAIEALPEQGLVGDVYVRFEQRTDSCSGG